MRRSTKFAQAQTQAQMATQLAYQNRFTYSSSLPTGNQLVLPTKVKQPTKAKKEKKNWYVLRQNNLERKKWTKNTITKKADTVKGEHKTDAEGY